MNLATHSSQPESSKRLAACMQVILLFQLIMLLPSGAWADEDQPRNIDPLEAINRPIYRLNDVADRYVLRPAGKGYNFVVPQVARTGIGNFFDFIHTMRNEHD